MDPLASAVYQMLCEAFPGYGGISDEHLAADIACHVLVTLSLRKSTLLTDDMRFALKAIARTVELNKHVD